MARTRIQNRLIAIAGPKGGIGRSTCTTVLAKALVARDQSVLIIDTSIYGNLAPFVDLPIQNYPSGFEILSTSKPRLDYVHHSTIETAETLLQRLRELQYDNIILDLRPELNDWNLDLFVRSDLPILMAAPEPTLIDMVTRWIRRSFVRYIRQFEENNELAQILAPQQDTWTYSSIANRLPPSLQNQWLTELASFRCAFMINYRREHSESLQSRALCHAWGMLLGLDIRYLGSMEFDDRRWFFIRQLADVSIFMREDPLVRGMDSIVRERLPNFSFEPRPCLAQLDVSTHARQFLRAETPEQARQQYRLLWEGYRRENGLVASVLSKDAIAQTIAQLEIAYRRSEETPAQADPPQPQERTTRSANETLHKPFLTTSPSSADANPDAGEWLTAKREEVGMTIAQLALKSRLPARTLEKLEHQRISGMPTARLQAYLFEIANALGIEVQEILGKFGLK